MKSRERNRLPPYMTYTTWRRLLEAFHQHLPGRVDGTYLRDLGFSDSTILTIKTGLYALDLVDDDHVPTERLRKLAEAQGDSQNVVLREMVEEAYQWVLGELNLETATTGLLKEKFAKYGADNNVGHKCVSFFLALAKDAGISLSPYLLNRSRIGATQKYVASPAVNPTRRRKPASSASRSVSARYESTPAPAPLITKLPDFNPDWPKEVRDEWFDHVQALQTMMAVMDKLPPFNAEWPVDLQNKWFECMRDLIVKASPVVDQNHA